MKKINKGFILTLIVLVALTLYILKVEMQRSADKEEIQKVYEEFIDFTDKYSVLPENLQTLNASENEKEIEQYKKQMKADLEKLMIDDEEAVNLQYDKLESVLTSGYNKLEVRTSQERRINKITTYRFNGNKLDVKFEGTVERKVKFYNGTEEQIETKKFDTAYDEIVLQKVDGEWKVKYSNLHFSKQYVIKDEDTTF